MFWRPNAKLALVEAELTAARAANETLHRENGRLYERVISLENMVDKLTEGRIQDLHALVDHALEGSGRRQLFSPAAPPPDPQLAVTPAYDRSRRHSNMRDFGRRNEIHDALLANLGGADNGTEPRAGGGSPAPDPGAN